MNGVLAGLPQAAADAITEHGWTQGTMQSTDGALCLTGALRACSPQPGDWIIARAVARHLGHHEAWNDNPDRTQAEVVGWLRSWEVTDAQIEATFGPQWRAVMVLVRQAAGLTGPEVMALAADSYTADTSARHAARDAARDAAWAAAAWNAAWAAVARDAAWAAVDHVNAAKTAAMYAAKAAASAVVVADLVGQHGFTQAYVDTLLGPWESVMGTGVRDAMVAGGAS